MKHFYAKIFFICIASSFASVAFCMRGSLLDGYFTKNRKQRPEVKQDVGAQLQPVLAPQEKGVGRNSQLAMDRSAVLPRVGVPVARRNVGAQSQQELVTEEELVNKIKQLVLHKSSVVTWQNTGEQQRQVRKQQVVAVGAGIKKRKRPEAQSARNVRGRVLDSVPFNSGSHFSIQ